MFDFDGLGSSGLFAGKRLFTRLVLLLFLLLSLFGLIASQTANDLDKKSASSYNNSRKNGKVPKKI